MTTTTNAKQVKMNIMTQAQYDAITPSPTELYALTDTDAITVDSALSSSSTNPVQNKVVYNTLNEKVSKSGDTMTGDLEINKAIYLTNIAASVSNSVSRLYFGPKSSPYNYITANTSGVFGIYNNSGEGISCYPTQNLFAIQNIDLGRSSNKWKDLYISGTLYDSSSSITFSNLISGANAGLTAIQPSDLATVATSGSYADLSNKPTIPTDTADLINGAGFLTSSDLTDGSLNAAFYESLSIGGVSSFYDSEEDILSISGSPIKIGEAVTIRTETDPETGDNILYITDDITSDTVTFSSQGGISVDTSTSGGEFTYNGSEVATLSDIPSIPTVNNATLTIQKNGTTVNTFTANASSNVTANITVPTDLGDLTNNAGYTKNVGTVTSVNNVSPVNGNVTLSIPSEGANKDLSNLTATGEAHFQAPLVSGTNIKTINNTSVLGSGNIDTNEIFVATYGVTSYADIYNAKVNYNKFVICDVGDGTFANLYNLNNNTCNFTRISGTASSSFGVDSNGWATLTEELEESSNKVTSISSSSTDTQYPSAKLLYDQLALKQNTSTAVTHTQNTAVGDSTTPVYIASNGTATSTGLSIASSRFDGQWVISQSILVDTDIDLAVNTGRTFDLSSYLPSDNYNYEVLVAAVAQSTSTSGGTVNVSVYSDLITNTDDIKLCVGRTRASSTIICGGNAIIPIGTGRTIGLHQANISGTASAHKATITNFRAIAYRRIGTNS